MQKERRHRSLFFERVANVRSEGTATWMATWTWRRNGRGGVLMTFDRRHPVALFGPSLTLHSYTAMAGLRRVVVVVVAVAMAVGMWAYADRLPQGLLLRTGMCPLSRPAYTRLIVFFKRLGNMQRMGARSGRGGRTTTTTMGRACTLTSRFCTSTNTAGAVNRTAWPASRLPPVPATTRTTRTRRSATWRALTAAAVACRRRLPTSASCQPGCVHRVGTTAPGDEHGARRRHRQQRQRSFRTRRTKPPSSSWA